MQTNYKFFLHQTGFKFPEGSEYLLFHRKNEIVNSPAFLAGFTSASLINHLGHHIIKCCHKTFIQIYKLDYIVWEIINLLCLNCAVCTKKVQVCVCTEHLLSYLSSLSRVKPAQQHHQRQHLERNTLEFQILSWFCW